MIPIQLKSARVLRGGVTSPYISHGTQNVRVASTGNLEFHFSISSKGGGRTRLQVEIEPDDFRTVVSAMTASNRQAAMLAMIEELADQVRSQPKLDGAARRKVQKEILDAADAKLRFAVTEPFEQRRIVQAGVAALIKQVNKA